MKPFVLLLLLLLPELAFAQQTFRLGLRRDFPAGADPAGVLVADFDHDGAFDLAVTERGVDSLTVRFGEGTGKFGPRVRYPTGDFPTAIAGGDLNQDGRLDLAIVNGASNTVTVYLGGPLGQFVGRIDYAVGLAPSGVTIGDANMDGHLDVVVANAGSSSVTILLGKSFENGLYGTSITVPTGTGPRAVLVADLDRDYVNDLATANTAADSISVIKGLPAGGFAARVDHATADQPIALAAGDLNTDGFLDLAIAIAGSPTVAIAPSLNGNFPTLIHVAAGATTDAVSIADFNDDAFPDLVVGHPSSSAITFLPGDGTGAYSTRQSVVSGGAGALSIAVADVDGDGRKDVVAPALTPPLVSVLLNNGAGPFGPHLDQPAGTTPQSLVVADLNADTLPDFAVANWGSANLSTYMNTGDSFAPKVDVPGPPKPSGLAARDLNGDLKVDLVTSTYSSIQSDTSRVSVFLNSGTGTFGARADFDVGTTQSRLGLAIGDVSDDGKADIVVGHAGSTIEQILLGNGLGSFAMGPTLTLPFFPYCTDLADLDGDGSLDVLVGNGGSFENGIVSVFLADGNGGFGPRVEHDAAGLPFAIVHGDFNGDGNLDFASVAIGNGTIAVQLGDGKGGFTPAPILISPGAQAYSLAVGDVNQDGDLDIVEGRADNTAAVFYGRGDGTFGVVSRFTAGGSGIMGVGLALFDANGTLDLVSAHQDNNNVSFYRGLTKTKTTLTVSPNPSALGQSLTYQATVTETVPDPGNPTGTVRFFDGVRLLGTAPLVGGVATLVQNGDLPWERELSAAYLGDGRFFGSFSAPVPHLTYINNVGVPPPAVARLALAPIGNPVRGDAVLVQVSLAGASSARLSLHDVRGRILASRELHTGGVAELAPSRKLSPGVYLVRLEQDGRMATARAVIL